MPRTDYRNRAAHVRRSARSHLKEIRAARLARKSALMSDEADQAPPDPANASVDVQQADGAEEQMVSETVATLHPEEPENSCPLDEIESAALAELAEESVPEEPPAAPEEDNDVVGADLDAPPLPDAKPTEAVDEAPLLADEAGEQERLVEEPTPAQPQASEQSDLAKLPGAGPGLVWLLNQCGVFSLAELATACPEQLGEKLGVVGQILDVRAWVDFAAAQEGAGNRSS